jgi:GTP-sensing pleiotropic transcriptional regulator CodY
MRTGRIIIYPKDIQRITGKSERYGRLLLKRIKDHFKKEDHQLVTVDEFCAYTGIKIELVTEYLYA